MLSIGEMSRRARVKIPTIRYYEEIGLMDPPERSEGNQRRYGPAALERLRFIRHARELGFGLDDIRALIALGDHPGRPCADATQIARHQLGEVRERIARLKRLEEELERLATGCDDGEAGECYVLRALADHGLCAADHR